MARLPTDRVVKDDPEISIARDAEGRAVGRFQRAFAMVEDGDVVECPLIVNGNEEARLRWAVKTLADRRGVVQLRLLASDNCPLTTLKRQAEPEPGP